MVRNVLVLAVLLIFMSGLCIAMAAEKPVGTEAGISLVKILDNIEARYRLSGFTADFFQSSTLKALNITDTAMGKISIKRPGKMRWIYEAPERQSIITDGTRLWIYRPEDNQVMLGAAPSYFGGGKGASFLTDIRTMQATFDIALETPDMPDRYKLKLVPKQKSIDVTHIFVWVARDTWEVREVATYNTYGDETRLEFSRLEFIDDLPDPLFMFTIPDGVAVVQLDR